LQKIWQFGEKVVTLHPLFVALGPKVKFNIKILKQKAK